MELSAGLLLLICLGAALAGLWHANLAAREAANRAAIGACEQLRLQFLDGTVAFAGLRIVRGPGGWLTLRRSYVFDYTSDSIARRRGFVLLTGARVDSVGFEQDAGEHSRLTDSVSPARRTEAPLEPRGGRVLRLDEWRGTDRGRTTSRDEDG